MSSNLLTDEELLTIAALNRIDGFVQPGQVPHAEMLEGEPQSIDLLLRVWQKAKANADTSRAILQLAEKEELEAREAVNKALRSAGWGGNESYHFRTD